MFYIRCIRGKIYPRNLINCKDSTQTLHYLQIKKSSAPQRLPLARTKEVQVWINLTQLILIFASGKCCPGRSQSQAIHLSLPPVKSLGIYIYRPRFGTVRACAKAYCSQWKSWGKKKPWKCFRKAQFWLEYAKILECVPPQKKKKSKTFFKHFKEKT